MYMGRRSRILEFAVILACVLSSAALISISEGQLPDKATRWFQAYYGTYTHDSDNDYTPPTIYDVSALPSVLKVGDPRSEINAFVHDPLGISMVYAEVANRMNLMLDLDRNGRYTGYCGSNMASGVYPVTIVAVDKAGNAALKQGPNLTILDPLDLDGDHIEDSLKSSSTHSSNDLRVIVLHDGNISDPTVGKTEGNFTVLQGSSMVVPGGKLDELSKQKGVKGIYKDQKLKIMAAPDLGSLGRAQTHGLDDPRKVHLGEDGSGVTVALLDTGVDPDHLALVEAGASKIIAFKDFVNNQTRPYDDNGHGTHCASLVAGQGEPGGVAPESKLVVVKVMDKDGACYLSDAITALDWCLENKDRYGIKVISFSVGGEGPGDGSSLLDQAVNRMVDEGLVMCVAAGNSGPGPGSIVIPGGAEKVITVGAVDRRGMIFDRSSRGPAADGRIKPDMVADGVDVVSALAGTGDGYSSMSGTSMAVPQVSGSAAVLMSSHPELLPADVKRILLKSADDLGRNGPDNTYGYGALNLTGALMSLDVSPDSLAGPVLEGMDLSKRSARVGDPVIIEAKVSGDVDEVISSIIGPDRNMDIPMSDLDSNGIFTAWWETSFWNPGDYEIEVKLHGNYGEVESSSVPFHLDPRGGQ